MRHLALLVVLVTLLGCDAKRRTAPTTTTTSAKSATPPVMASASATASASAAVDAGATDRDWVARTLRQADPRFEKWLSSAEEHRIQILVSELRRDGKKPELVSHGFRVDAEYVYPASAIKTFVSVAALLALPTIAERHEVELDRRTLLKRCQRAAGRCEVYEEDEDEEEEDGTYRIGREIQKLLSYSDNHSYERIYDLVGHQELNEIIAGLGFSSVRIHHRMGAPAERSRTMPRVIVMPRGGRSVTIPARESEHELPPTAAEELKIGTAYKDGSGLVDKPMDFGEKNYASLRDLQKLHVALVLPEAEGAVALGLSQEDRSLLVKAMTGKLKPRAHATRHKPMLPGVLEVVKDKHLRYVNKSGRAYGFLLENAYLEDTSTGKAFFVTAVIYANENGVLNDDDYEYDEVSRPFMEALGEALARELLR